MTIEKIDKMRYNQMHDTKRCLLMGKIFLLSDADWYNFIFF